MERTTRRPGRPAGDAVEMRARILAAAQRQLLEATVPEQVTIASVIAEAGCTPPALYHYWKHRELLLQEASGRAWLVFHTEQHDAASGVDDPLERLRARGRAYVEFALARPAAFLVLFSQPAPPPEPGGELPPTSRSLEDLTADVVSAMNAGLIAHTDDPMVTALVLWSAMHGVADLWAKSPVLPHELARTVLAQAQDAILTGLRP